MPKIGHCKTCGKEIHRTGLNPYYSYCSDTCKAAWLAVTRYGSIPIKVTKQCVRCGTEFETKLGWKKFCCTRCQQLDNRERNEKIVKRDSYYQLRFSIMARDGFRCRYCGRSAQDDGVKLNVDHIVPKDKGGNNEPSNLITACQDCNVGKGTLLLLAKAGQIPSYITIESLTDLPHKKVKELKDRRQMR